MPVSSSASASNAKASRASCDQVDAPEPTIKVIASRGAVWRSRGSRVECRVGLCPRRSGANSTRSHIVLALRSVIPAGVVAPPPLATGGSGWAAVARRHPAADAGWVCDNTFLIGSRMA